MRHRLGVLLAAAALCAAVTPVTAAAAGAGALNKPVVGLRHSTSSNWSGYAAYGKSGQFSSVSATWTEPKLKCSSGSQYSAFWVGLDGYNSNTVEQLGTEADCSGTQAVHSAWFELYPHWPVDITSSVNVVEGHTYTASVTYSASKYILTLDDLSSNPQQHFSTSQKASGKRSSAEIIAEAPWSSHVLPLANFGTVNFSGSMVNGKALGASSNLDPMTMVDPYGGTATPSTPLANAGKDFSITWS